MMLLFYLKFLLILDPTLSDGVLLKLPKHKAKRRVQVDMGYITVRYGGIHIDVSW